MLERMFRCDQVVLLHQVFDEAARWQVSERLEVAHEVQALAADFIVENELGQAEGQNEIEHAGPRDRVDAGDRSEQRARESFTAALRIEELGVRERHVGLRRQAERFGDRNVGDIEVLRFDGGHRRTRRFHVKCRRCATEQNRRTGPNNLRHRDTGKDIDTVEYECADESDRSDQTHQGDRYDFDRDAGFDTVEQVLTGVFAVAEIAGRRDRKNRVRPRDEVGTTLAKDLEHVRHARHTVFREGAGHDRFFRRRQAHIQTPGVRHPCLDVLVRREGCCQVGDVLQPVAQSGVFDEVGRVCEPRLPGSMVLDLQATRAWHVMYVISAEFGMRLAVSIEKRKRRRGIADRFLDDLRREQYALATVVGF